MTSFGPNTTLPVYKGPYFWYMQLEKKELQNSKGQTFMKVYFEDDWRCTVDVWTGAFESVVNFTNGLMLVLDNIKEFRSRKWLTDLRRIEGDFSFVNPFMTEMLVPRAIHYGLEFEAIVVPDNIFTRLSATGTIRKINNLEIQIFSSMDDATDWLNGKLATPTVFRTED